MAKQAFHKDSPEPALPPGIRRTPEQSPGVLHGGVASERLDAASPFRTWNGVEAWQFVDGVRLHAIGGEQILLCRVTYEPGKQVPDHDHEHTEQVMAIVDGEVTVTVDGETRELRAGDVIVINRGIRHSLVSENGVTFFEALAPVPLDHVPDRTRDLVLGPDGGSSHVER